MDEDKYSASDLVDHSAIAAIIRNDDGAVLMMDHVKLNLWTVPIGKIEPGESPEEALLVELGEELDIVPTTYTEIATHDMSFARNGRVIKITGHLFQVHNYCRTIKNNEPSKHRSIRFMFGDEIRKLDNVSDAVRLMIDLKEI